MKFWVEKSSVGFLCLAATTLWANSSASPKFDWDNGDLAKQFETVRLAGSLPSPIPEAVPMRESLLPALIFSAGSDSARCGVQLFKTAENPRSYFAYTLVVNQDGNIVKKGHIGDGGAEYVLNSEGYYVHPKFKDKKDVIYASWAGGGLNFMPQWYLVVKRAAGTYTVYLDKGFFQRSEIYCSEMIPDTKPSQG